MIAITHSGSLNKKVYNSLAAAIAVTLFLFFIDEGYYNFSWMNDARNWLAFILYVVLLWLPQLFLIAWFLPGSSSKWVAAFRYAGGIVAGICIAFYLFS